MSPYIEIFKTFLQSGGLAIGSSHAVIAPVRKKVVEEQAWLSEEEYAQAVAIAEAMPGVFSLNLCAYLGHKRMGWGGGAAAVAGVLLPPLLLVAMLVGLFGDYHDSPQLESFLKGARPAIVALVAIPCVQMLRTAKITLSTVWLPVGAAVGIWLLNVSPVLIVAAITIAGILYATFVRPNE